MKPSEWVNRLLQRHSLVKPDGRPLYQYRITDEEYQELLKVLRLSSLLGFNNIRTKVLMWDAVMVFYASEWWRRHYIGMWGWEGIFDSIGLAGEDISTLGRSSLVEIGLRRWGRDVRERKGRRQFLGTIATEGGLPLNQLSESGGWLKNVLSPIIKKNIARNLPVDSMIEAYESSIPKSYRSAEIKQILEDIVHSIISLRNRHELQIKEKPLDWLDNNIDGWWNSFPLPVDNEVARSLLRELIIIAGDTPAVEKTNPFILERYLINESFTPVLHAKLEMPRYVLCEALPQIDFSILPGRFELVVKSDCGKSYPWCRAIRTEYHGKPALRLSGKSLVLDGESATSQLKLQFKLLGQAFADVPIVGAISMEMDVPWMFRKTESNWHLYGVTSQAISDINVLVYVPGRLKVESQSETTKLEFVNDFFEGKLFKLEGKVLCRSIEERYNLETGAPERFTQYHFSGRCFEGISKPANIYIGIPSLNETNTLTGNTRRNVKLGLMAKPIGVDTKWKPIENVESGYFEVRLNDVNGDIIWRRRIGILNEEFNYKILPSRQSPLAGEIKIEGCSECQLSAVAKNSNTHVDSSKSSTVLNFKANERPPMDVQISILPRHHKRELLIKIPFPSIGSLLFGPEGESLSLQTTLFLNDLYGYRIRLFSERGNIEGHLRFSLVDSDMSQGDLRDMFVDKVIQISAQVSELAIIDWYKVIQQLLGVSRSLRSVVRISLLVSGQEMFRLNVRRFAVALRTNWLEGTVSLSEDDMAKIDTEVLERSQIKAFRLLQPEQKTFELVAVRTEECHLGKWDFYPERREEGAWLIIPAKNSSLQFEPRLWIVNSSEVNETPIFLEGVHSLQTAMSIADKNTREQAIRLLMHQMSNDLEHRSWQYLSHLWDVSQHLPLATFDLWRLSVSEPAFLAALLVQGYLEVIQRLEEELPIIWELVRISDWASALSSYKASYERRLKGESGQLDIDDLEIVESMLCKRMNAIADISYSMKNMGVILTDLLLGKRTKELELMKLPIDGIVKPRIEAAFQNMLRRNSNRSKWPKFLNIQIKDIFQKFPRDLRDLIDVPLEFQEATAYLPLILAWRINTGADYGWLGREVNIFKLAQIRNFDEEWFSNAFEDICIWLSQQQLTTNETE